MPAMHARLQPVPQTGSHRAQLGEVIRQRDELRRRTAAVAAALDAAFRDRIALRAELEASIAKVPIADQAATAALVAKAMGGKASPARSPADARAAVEKLETDIDASISVTKKFGGGAKTHRGRACHCDRRRQGRSPQRHLE